MCQGKAVKYTGCGHTGDFQIITTCFGFDAKKGKCKGKQNEILYLEESYQPEDCEDCHRIQRDGIMRRYESDYMKIGRQIAKIQAAIPNSVDEIEGRSHMAALNRWQGLFHDKRGDEKAELRKLRDKNRLWGDKTWQADLC